jgi:hypothetical protein
VLSFARGENEAVPISPFYCVILGKKESEGWVHFYHFLTGKISTSMTFDELVCNYSKKVRSSVTLSSDDIYFPKLLRRLREDAEMLCKDCFPSKDVLSRGESKDRSSKNLFRGKTALPKPYLVELDDSDTPIDLRARSSEHDQIDREIFFSRNRLAANTWTVCIQMIFLLFALYLALYCS